MIWEGIIVLIIIFVGFGFLIWDKYPPELIFLGELIIIWNANIITSKEALQGFSNSGLIAIGALYIVVRPLSDNKMLKNIFTYLLNSKKMQTSLTSICVIVGILSAFLNNTPLVALVTPIIREISRIKKYPSSQFLMPISFASIIGGTCTIIGTSTNIIIQSLLIDSGNTGIHFFELSLISIPFMTCFIVYNYFFYKIIPIRSGLYHEVKDNYLVQLRVKTTIIIEKIFDDLHLTANDIVGIYNEETKIVNYSFQNNVDNFLKYQLPEEDTLIIKSSNTIIDKIFSNKNYFINNAELSHFLSDKNIMLEIVVGNTTSSNIDHFENKYNCKIIASRKKHIIENIERGDTLLVMSNNEFYDNWHNSNDFYMMSKIHSINNDNFEYLPLFFFIITIGLASANILTIDKSAMTCVFLYFIFGIMNVKTALKSIDYNLLLMIGSSFAIAQSMSNSGLNENIAHIISACSVSPYVILLIIVIFSQLLTEVITNNAIAILMTNIAIDVAKLNGLNYKPFIIALMISCSSSFLTPYGYATNIIVQGPGNYKFVDYFRFGLFPKISSIAFCMIVPLIWKF